MTTANESLSSSVTVSVTRKVDPSRIEDVTAWV